MALIVITIHDDPKGDVNVSMVSSDPIVESGELTGAQECALNMLQAMQAETDKKEPGRIALLS